MEMQQMMELLLKEFRATKEDFLAKLDVNEANRNADTEERKAEKKELLALMEANQAKADARHKEMMAEQKAWREEMAAMRAKKLKAWGEERRTTHEKIESHPEVMQSVLEHREVPV
ncbi:hypothetical protein B7P43_G18002, partial [Cryptotermes secundus]